uniref:Uncharacterized protein n=1 Tax=Anguilla anguilla TaxID=7936 RepID=A0A0E9RIL6_ANGAN
MKIFSNRMKPLEWFGT